MKLKKKKLTSEEKAAKKELKALKKANKPVKSRVQKTIEKHRVNVARYIKVSNRFERQKLSRRQTEQKKDPEKVAKILTEIAASNALDPEVLADRHMRKTFSKIRSVYESPELPDKWRATTKETVLEPALANVSARLYSHKLVKMAMNKCVNNVRMAIAHQTAEKLSAGDEAEGKKARAGVTLGRLEDDMRDTPDLPDAPLKLIKAKSLLSLAEQRTEEDEFSEDDVLNIYDGEDAVQETAPTAIVEVETTQEPQIPQSRKRKASETVEEESSASDASSSEEEASASHSTSYSSSSDSEPARKKTKTKQTSTSHSTAVAASANNSVFVPSLTAVGYAVNSDSEASDLDEEVAPRKNRRGQKARQAIWEKKYKEKAKHLQKQQQSQQAQGRRRGKHKGGGHEGNDGWDPRRGAVDESVSQHRRQRRDTDDFAAESKKSRDDSSSNKPLHPSWEAKKQLKAKEKVIDQYAGKKITF